MLLDKGELIWSLKWALNHAWELKAHISQEWAVFTNRKKGEKYMTDFRRKIANNLICIYDINYL